MDFILEHVAGTGPISAKKMFGEYGHYLDGNMFGVSSDEQLFAKSTPAVRDYATDLPEGIRRESLAVAKLWCSSRLLG